MRAVAHLARPRLHLFVGLELQGDRDDQARIDATHAGERDREPSRHVEQASHERRVLGPPQRVFEIVVAHRGPDDSAHDERGDEADERVLLDELPDEVVVVIALPVVELGHDLQQVGRIREHCLERRRAILPETPAKLALELGSRALHRSDCRVLLVRRPFLHPQQARERRVCAEGDWGLLILLTLLAGEN